MTSHARAILWAQFRSWINYYPRSNRAGSVLGALLAVVWYGMWVWFAFLIFRVFADPANDKLGHSVLPAGLFFVFLYWQLVPVLLAATGVSLELKKLQVYPIPHAQLFLIELMLRVTASFEMFVITGGLAAGLFGNPRLPRWAALGLVPFIVFNLAVSAGTREIFVRLMARKRVREVAVLLLVSVGAIPQLLIVTGAWQRIRDWFQRTPGGWWPWSAAAQIASGEPGWTAPLMLAVWTAAGYWFGRSQFEKTLSFDAAESAATRSPALSSRTRPGLWDRAARWPSALFADPLAAVIEKEMRFLARAPRFRLVFAMGFTFGLVIWLPVVLKGGGSRPGFFANNFLTMVAAYAILLLGDVCFWNVFGFDRSAAQAFWAMPVRFETVLAGKNVAALFFVLLEVTLITAICAALRMPVNGTRIAEAYSVAIVLWLYLAGLGNLTSTSAPRALNPAKSMRSGAPGKLQAMLFIVYPLAAIPVALAYGARYAFRGEWAFFAVLILSALAGAAVYWVALESAVETAERDRERIITALSQGDGIIQA